MSTTKSGPGQSHDYEIAQTSAGWVATCACSWHSKPCTQEPDAAAAANRHFDRQDRRRAPETR